MHVIRTVSALRAAVKILRQAGKTIAFVPTMGALHAGHISLVTRARNVADVVVSSIFVNPKQFGPREDLASYPRPEAEDLARLVQAEVDIAYLPSVEEMYGEGFNTAITVTGVSEGLCGSKRAGHFDGVALVVTKFLLQLLPDIAVFGEKDYQQLLVVKRLVHDLNIPVDIISAPIFREEDGLAMSSRNRYLNQEERKIATVLHQQLQQLATMLRAGGCPLEEAIAAVKHYLLEEGFTSVDYIELRNADNLQPVDSITQPARLLAAAYLGKCRLIDNIAINPV